MEQYTDPYNVIEQNLTISRDTLFPETDIYRKDHRGYYPSFGIKIGQMADEGLRMAACMALKALEKAGDKHREVYTHSIASAKGPKERWFIACDYRCPEDKLLKDEPDEYFKDGGRTF